MSHEHYFICPHCGNRSMGLDRQAGFRREARGCERCGFAYLFEAVELRSGPERAAATADIFPAYDDEEGGVLVVLTPANHR